MTGVEKLLENRTPNEVAAALTSEGRSCTRQLVEYWQKNGYVTPKWALMVSSKFDIPLHELIAKPN